ncbi:MAG: hypothetical protein ABDH59_02495 [Fervidobacterium sp.]
MKIEFYAVFFFLLSIILFLVLISQKREITQEEVLPSPFLSVRNPYQRFIKQKANEINKQLFFLEYNKCIPTEIKDMEELEEIIFQVQDVRARKQVIKRVWRYWWGIGIEEVTFKIKHISLTWYPFIYYSKDSHFTFGEALYYALNGRISTFSIMKSDESLIRLIAEKYKVEIIDKNR